MRIAQIAPLFESVPPKRYGGTERVVYWLTEELVAMGHAVTLFASGDSTTSAELVPVRARAARFVPNFERNNAPYARMLELVARRAHAFDMLHFHIDFHPFPLFTRQPKPFVNTLHGRLDQDWVAEIYDLFPDVPLVSVSDSQRRPMPRLNWAATVLHGMPSALLTPQPAGPRDYFAFLGRISPEKGIESAIRIAAAAGARLKVAAKIGEEARAVRAGDDRSDGLRLPGHRLRSRQRARGGGRRSHRLCGRRCGGGGGGVRPDRRARPCRRSPPFRTALDLAADGERLRCPL